MTLDARSSLTDVSLSVGDALRRHGIRAVLTGGACANLYSAGTYHSLDVDFVLSGRVKQADLDAAMESVGFRRVGDRYVHAAVRYYVEFPLGPLALGEDHAVRPVLRTKGQSRTLALSATDACRDRLAAFFHWHDRQSLRAAVQIALRNRISMRLVRAWSEKEGALPAFEEFMKELTAARSRRGRRPG